MLVRFTIDVRMELDEKNYDLAQWCVARYANAMATILRDNYSKDATAFTTTCSTYDPVNGIQPIPATPQRKRGKRPV